MADKFTINEKFAANYNKWREREEYQKLKDKYGDDESIGTSSSSSSSEDEDAIALTTSLEKDWLKTYAAIKKHDPTIYDKSVAFYHSHDENSDESNHGVQQAKKAKPVFLKDYDRKIILEREGRLSDDESEEDEEQREKMVQRMQVKGYFEEQEEIKNSIKKAVSDSESGDDGDFLVARKRTLEEKEKEDTEYTTWRKSHKSETQKQVGVDVDLQKDYLDASELDDGEKFLRNYILNRDYLEKTDDRIPTYDEITREDDELSADERELEKQELFEHKYNFRYEEPDPDFIKTYPRTISESVRRKDDRRVKKRNEARERKKREKEIKMEEVKQMKNLKKKEIADKLEQLKQITGNPTVGFSSQELDEDFDPAKHDKLMKAMFSEHYYNLDDDDDSKPVFSDDDGDGDFGLDIQNWDDWTGPSTSSATGTITHPDPQRAEQLHEGEADCENPNFNMDADYDPSEKQQKQDFSFGLDGRKKRKKKQRKSKLFQQLETRKPVFDPSSKSFEEYCDEYYKLDYEDMIGDQPCRFHYRSTLANDFGLSTDEVLSCPDKQLNNWVSIKKMSQYRTEEEEKLDIKVFRKKCKMGKKQRILTTLQEEKTVLDQPQKSTAKKRKKKKKKKGSVSATVSAPPHPPYERKPTQEGEKHSQESGANIISLQTTGTAKRKQEELDMDSKSVTKKARLEQTTALPARSKKSTTKKDKQLQRRMMKHTTDGSASFTNTGGFTVSVPTQKKIPVSNDSDDKSRVSITKKKKKKKKESVTDLSDERLKAYGIDPKKFKYTYLKRIHEQKKKSR